MTWGELARSRESYLRVRQIGERFGQETFLRWIRSGVVNDGYYLGDWDQAVRAAGEFIDAVEEGDPHYDAIGCHAIRSLIRFARGDLPRASVDAERAVELGRRAKDPQVLYGALVVRAAVVLTGPAVEAARAGVDEIIRGLSTGVSFGGVAESLPTLAWVMRDLGRAGELVSVLPASLPFRWATAARAVVAGDFGRAAEICAEIGSKPDEAYARLRGAEQLSSEGRRGDADEQLQFALAFWRSVGATRYIREGEALLTATA